MEGLFIERRVFIAGEHGEGKAFNGDVEPLFSGQKFKAVADGGFLEVIAEGPVAEHFEKGQMDGIAHFVNIAGPDALLNVAESFSERMGGSQEKGNQRMHSGCCKKNGRVVIRNQRSAFYDGVSFAFKKFQKFRSELICIHLSIKPPVVRIVSG